MYPLVSAIMPTQASREEFLSVALECWHRQTWPVRELIVCDDADGALEYLVPEDSQTRYLRNAGTLGQKRNLCCEAARGEFIVHFDDDDWSAPRRIFEQMEALRSPTAAVTGFNALLFFEETRRQLWRYDRGRPDFAIGTTLLYRREWWTAHPFEDVNTCEDCFFVDQARRAGVLHARGFPGGLMVARIHPGNSSEKLGSPQWQRVAYPLPPGFRPIQ